MTEETPRIVLPSEAANEEMRAAGMAVLDPVEIQRAHDAFVGQLREILRLTAADVCGMTSTWGELRTFRTPAYWLSGMEQPIPTIRRFASWELSGECMLWGAWLARALGVTRAGPDGERIPVPLATIAERYPAPPTRPFEAPIWPGMGHEPVPRPPAPRKRKARRS